MSQIYNSHSITYITCKYVCNYYYNILIVLTLNDKSSCVPLNLLHGGYVFWYYIYFFIFIYRHKVDVNWEYYILYKIQTSGVVSRQYWVSKIRINSLEV